jgi:acyl-CoA dehydrogenase
MIKTRAERVGDELVINGHKWFTSNGSTADILIVMAVTNPDVHPYQGMSMVVVPSDTPGVNILRNVGTMAEPEHPLDMPGGHAEIIYEDVRVPYENLLGGEGQAFVLAQKRLGPGRIHHVMRWIGQANRAFRMMCERAVSREVFGEPLARKQTIQNWIAESSAEIHALRLMTLHAAWKMDREGSSAARVEIAQIKFWGGKVLHDAIDRAIQVNGSLGYTTDLPLELMYRMARAGRIYDGPDEVHRVTVARQILKGFEAVEVPTEHIPTRSEAAQKKFAWLLEEATANL